jgi:uncharacterized phage-associated protein
MKRPCVIRFRLTMAIGPRIVARYIRSISDKGSYKSTSFKRAAYEYYNVASATKAYHKLLAKIEEAYGHMSNNKPFDITILRRIKV